MQKIVFGVKSLITLDDKFLVLVKPNGELDLPGGCVELGERLRESLHREIQEETGLKVEIIDPLAYWSFMKNSQFSVKGITYLCRYLSGDVVLSDEHSGCFWCKLRKNGSIFHESWLRHFF